MPSTTAKNSLALKFSQDATHAAVFTADPGLTGTVTGEVTGGAPAYARKAITWSAPSNGVVTASVVFDIPAGTTLLFAAACSALTGANLLDKGAVTSQNFATQGTYTLALTATIA